MLAAALADPDPVLIFEHAGLYNMEDDLPDVAGVDIRCAKVRRVGSDVAIFAYGGCLRKALEAADLLAEGGVNAEVVDLRVLRPLDDATIMASVTKCRRAVIVDECWRSASVASEIATRIVEQAFYELDAPVARVCAADVPIPYARHMEEAALPQPATIADAARRLLS